MVCLMPQSQVSGSFEYLHLSMFNVDFRQRDIQTWSMTYVGCRRNSTCTAVRTTVTLCSGVSQRPLSRSKSSLSLVLSIVDVAYNCNVYSALQGFIWAVALYRTCRCFISIIAASGVGDCLVNLRMCSSSHISIFSAT